MGRKETSCLSNLSCDSMEHQTMKVRPVLLKRKSLDSTDSLKHSHHRKTKSQQVRFKEDSTNTNSSGFDELETKPGETPLVNGKAEQRLNKPMCLLPCPKSQRGLQNIAIQTSPSLRKHFPIFKAKKLIANKPLKELSSEPSNFQVNGDISEEGMATQLSHLRISEHFEEGFKRVIRHCPLRHTVPKAQSNGPISECSGMDFADMLGKATVSTQVPENLIEGILEEIEESNFTLTTDETIGTSLELSNRCDRNFSQPSDADVCLISKQRENQESFCQSKHTRNEALPLKPSADCKRIITLKPSLNSNLSYCFHSEHQQADKSQKDSDYIVIHNVDRTVDSTTKDEELQSVTTTDTGAEKNMTQPESSQCRGGMVGTPCHSRNQAQHETNKERNPEHKAHGGSCSLQGKLQSIEESLQSNQEKIKILLNVIQDLEKARALSEGRNFYRTGQDLNNCSTCQSTACIIYSVEYDFRQQEGRFHQVIKMLDKVEQCPILAPLPKPEPENVTPEKQDVRKKSKKVKKKCFWWI